MLLRMTAGRGGQSRLTLDQETNLSAWLEGRFCRSAGEIRAFITAEFELGYSHSGCLKMLRRLGFD
jgi:transposase